MDILLKFEDSTEAEANDAAGPLGLQARTQNRCIVCGQENPYGLHIHFVRERDGAISAEWRPTEKWEGFKGIVHGGIISTVLDEAVSKAVAAIQVRGPYRRIEGQVSAPRPGRREPSNPGMGREKSQAAG